MPRFDRQYHMNSIRTEIENAIKQHGISRQRAAEVSKLEYSAIIRRIKKAFVRNDGCLHWSNLGNFKPALRTVSVDSRGLLQWYHHIAGILPDRPVYVLLEDDYDKFWVYEMYPREMCRILDECSLCDIYVCSKKYDWLVSENHSGGLYFVGEITPPEALISALEKL